MITIQIKIVDNGNGFSTKEIFLEEEFNAPTLTIDRYGVVVNQTRLLKDKILRAYKETIE